MAITATDSALTVGASKNLAEEVHVVEFNSTDATGTLADEAFVVLFKGKS